MKILFFVFSLLSILYWLKKDFNAYFFFFSFFSRNVYNQLSRERTSSGIKIVSVGRIVPLRESCERTPEKNRVDVRLRVSVNDVIRIDRLLFLWTNGDLTKPIPAVLLPCQRFFGWFIYLHIKDKFHCWESISLHGVSTYEKAWTKEKNQIFAIKSVRFHLRENVRLWECINTEFD